MDDDPLRVLGLGPDATDADVRRARRRLAKALHPDVHDTAGRADAERRMALVNQASDLLLDRRRRSVAAPDPTPAGQADQQQEFADAAFIIAALPVDAFEATLLAAVNLGDVVRAEEPYLLAVLLDHPGPCQCLLELVPDAGATTVTIEIAPRHFGRPPTVPEVRDALVAEISRQAGTG